MSELASESSTRRRDGHRVVGRRPIIPAALWICAGVIVAELIAVAGLVLLDRPDLLWLIIGLAAVVAIVALVTTLWRSTVNTVRVRNIVRSIVRVRGGRGRPPAGPDVHERRSAPPLPDEGLARAVPPDPVVPLRPDGPIPPAEVPPPSQGGGARPPHPPPRALPPLPPVLEGGSRAGQAVWQLSPRSGQPGGALDAARVGDLDVRAGSVIGPGHRCVEPAGVRQDAYALGQDARGERLVIAVADGLSSSESSDVGARVAVSTAVREIVRALDDSPDPARIDAARLFTTVAGEMVGTGRDRGLADRDLCCLLVVAVVPTAADPDGSRRVWTAQLGDVSVWTYLDRPRQQTGAFKDGLDRNTVDAVLPFHPDAVATTSITLAGGERLAVVTDGIGDLLTDVGSASGFFQQRWAVPPHPAVFLLDLCVDAPGQDDDRTAVVVWCGAQGDPRTREPR